MLVQVKTDNHVHGGEALSDGVQSEVTAALGRFDGQITRVEVFLSDVNGQKNGTPDKRCVMQAHVAGLPQLVVNHEAGSVPEAVTGATERLERLIDKSVERRGQRKGAIPLSANDSHRGD